MFEDFKTKDSVTIVYTGEGKGKTSAAIGLLVRALGSGFNCVFIQFIKYWDVGEHKFLEQIGSLYPDHLTFYKGGLGFYAAKDLSAKGVSLQEHKAAAQKTYSFALECSESGKFDLVVCDEINNAAHDGLLTEKQLALLIQGKHKDTSLCLTGRDFPQELIESADIVTEMKKLKHHFDDEYLANKGIDY
jgi:cob(I)alamin adenosyltransferase